MAMPTKEFGTIPLPIVGQFNVQRFKQFGPEDSANFYCVHGEQTKRSFCMYPTLGRAHVNSSGVNRLIFDAEPRGLFKSIDYQYVVVGSSIFRIDSDFNEVEITGGQLQTPGGNIFFAYLIVNSTVFSCFVDQRKIYVYQENAGPSGAFYVVTDPNAPGNFIDNGVMTRPGYIAAFGNRIVVSVADSSQFVLSIINLLTAGVFNPATCFTNAPPQLQTFATEDGIIRQMGVLNNTLYIFTDFVTGVWSNFPAVFSGTNTTFPWKKSSTYNWNFGIADPLSLDIDFGMLVFLAQNSDGLLQVMMSMGGLPEAISSEAVDVMFQRYSNLYGDNSPFLSGNASGFLYQYENKIFYRLSGGPY